MLHLLDNPQDVVSICDKLGAGPVVGCAVPQGKQCHVYMAKPQIGYPADKVLPHEIEHCFFGDTHD